MLREIRGFQEHADRDIRTIQAIAMGRIERGYSGRPMHFTTSLGWNVQENLTGNWHYAMGDFSYTTTASVTVTPMQNGQLRVRLDSTLHVFDRYNWDAGKVAIIGPYSIGPVQIFPRTVIEDRNMGRLHQTGLAREYEIRGSLPRPVQTFTMPAPAIPSPRRNGR